MPSLAPFCRFSYLRSRGGEALAEPPSGYAQYRPYYCPEPTAAQNAAIEGRIADAQSIWRNEAEAALKQMKKVPIVFTPRKLLT